MAESTEEKLAGAAADIEESTDAPGIIDDPALENEEVEAQLETQEAVEAADGPVDAPQRPAWIDGLGDDFKGLDETGAQQRLAQLRAAKAEADQLRQERQWFQFQQQQLAQRQQQEQVAKPQEPAKPKREVPPYDPSWVNLVTKDEKGNWVAVPGAQPDLPQKLAAYAAWRDAEQAKWLNDPAAYIQEVAGDHLKQITLEAVQQHLNGMQSQAEQQQEFQAVAQFEAQNAVLFYEDPQTMTRPTAIGMECLRRQQQYVQQGVRSRFQAAQLALRDMYAEAEAAEYRRLQQSGQAKATTQQAAAAQRLEFQKRATPTNGVKKTPGRKPAAPEAVFSTSTSSLGLLQKKFAERGHKVREDAAV